jgi:hypothetical protein
MIIVFAVVAASAAPFSAQRGDPTKPKSRKDVHSAVVLPDTATCESMVAFDVTLGENASASPISVTRTNVKWAITTTVSEFEPARPMPPYTRFIFMETPKSHRVSWAMGVAFFASEALARQAGRQIAEWYADALDDEVGEGSFGYVLGKGDLALMILVYEKSVQVSCEHTPTQLLAIQEGVDLKLGR